MLDIVYNTTLDIVYNTTLEAPDDVNFLLVNIVRVGAPQSNKKAVWVMSFSLKT